MNKSIAACLLGLLLFAGFAYAKKPRVSFDHSADFNRYKTYAWAQGTAAPDQIVHQVILMAVEYELKEAGLQKADFAKADLWVRYDVDLGAELSSAASDPTYAASGGFAPITPTALWTTGGSVSTLLKGSLCVRLLDQAEKRVVWTSLVEENLDDRRRQRLKQVSQVVEKMFKDFPRKN